jgi:hypothetical protein
MYLLETSQSESPNVTDMGFEGRRFAVRSSVDCAASVYSGALCGGGDESRSFLSRLLYLSIDAAVST